MSCSKGLLAPLLLAGLLFPSGCVSPRAQKAAHFTAGEPVVLAGQEPARLAFAPTLSRPVDVRSTYRADLPKTIHYQPGRDYVLDAGGQIRRTEGSRIPDFRTNVLFGKEDFQHGQFPGFGNTAFFVYVDYFHREKWAPAQATAQFGSARLPKTQQKLRSGQPVRIVAFGDSITAGGEASEPKLIFWERWAEALRQKYPRAAIEALNGATGGDTTANGLQRLQEKVVAPKPDLVLIGFGMNDHNREGFGVPLPRFEENLRALVDQARAATGAEVMLFSTFPPNPKWHYGTHNMAAYAAATERVALEKQCAYADVYHLWTGVVARKQPEDLLANNINHPNDFGHWLYFQALQTLGL